MKLNCTSIIMLWGLLFVALVAAIGLNRPLIEYHDATSVTVGGYAQNYMRQGYWKSSLLIISKVYPDGQYETNNRQPFLVPLLLSFGYRILGINTFTTRILGLANVLTAASALAGAVKQKWNGRLAWAAWFFMAFSPVNQWYTATRPSFEGTALAFSMLCLYVYITWLQQRRSCWLIALAVLVFVGCFTAWQFHYIVIVICLHYSIFRYRRNRHTNFHWFLVATLGSMAMAVGIYAYLVLSQGSPSSGNRGGIAEAISRHVGWDVSLVSWMVILVRYTVKHFTPILPLLALFWLLEAMCCRWGKERGLREQIFWVIALCLYGVIHLLTFRQYIFGHSFLVLQLSPALALAAALAFERARQRKVRPCWRWGLLATFLALSLVLTAKYHYDPHYPQPSYLEVNAFKVELAQSIREVTRPTDQLAFTFDIGRGGFYLGRYYEEELSSRQALNFKPYNFDYLVVLNEAAINRLPEWASPTVSPDFLQFLQARYPYHEYTDFTLYSLPSGMSQPLE